MERTKRFDFPVNRFFPECLRLKHPLLKEFLSEIAATFISLLVGVGSVLEVSTSRDQNGTFVSINLAWGFGVMFGNLLGSGTSGGHMNPAVTLTQFLLGLKTLRQLLTYIPAQLIGAFLGTALAFYDYEDALLAFDGGHHVATGPNGSLCFLVTCPKGYESKGLGVLDQVIATGLIGITMAAMLDRQNGIPNFIHPLMNGFVVMMIGVSYGVNDSYPCNPARDFGARLFALVIYGWEAISYQNYWFWVPIVGPTLGCISGAFIYNFFFDFHKPSSEQDTESVEGLSLDSAKVPVQ